MTKEMLLQISKLIDCEYEIGIWSEINSFMDYHKEDIVDYKLEFIKEEKSFYLSIKMKEYNLNEVNDFFNSFVHFIEYSNATFYVQEKGANNIKYYLLSSMNTEKGTFIQLLFY